MCKIWWDPFIFPKQSERHLQATNICSTTSCASDWYLISCLSSLTSKMFSSWAVAWSRSGWSSSVGGTEYEINERRRPVRSQRFFRSRSSGNLLEDHEYQEKQETRDHQLNYKQCLIQQDEEENNFDEFQSDFERRLQITPNNVNHQFRRYS